MTVSEKHRKMAEQVFADADLVETVPQAVEIIAAALAAAEREGMRRAAEIARAQKPLVFENGMMRQYHQGDIAAAILSEAGET